MILSSLGLEGKSAQLAAEAQAALAAGDTDRAAALHKEAGEFLEGKVRNRPRQSEKHLLPFLAATQYYHGGLYVRAAKLTRNIQTKFLPAEVRSVFEQFVRDVSERSDERYRARVRAALLRAWRAEGYQEVLGLLQEHPYAVSRGRMAFFRACCCERLKDYRAAALFFADTLRFEPDNLAGFLSSVEQPLTLMREGKLSEAWAYVEHQLAAIQHPLPNILASLLCCHQARTADSTEERRRLVAGQIGYFETAWDLFQRLPPQQQQDETVRDLLTLNLEAAALGLWILGDAKRAAELANLAVAFAPTRLGARRLRGIVTYPAEGAIQDFEEVIRQGDPLYYAYYYLAHAAFDKEDFERAVFWCEEALQHGPSVDVKAHVLEMLAISRAALGYMPDAIEQLFAAAQQLAPGNPRLAQNLSVFRAAVAAGAPLPKQQWLRESPQDGYEHDGALQEGEFLLANRIHADSERELLAVG